MSKLKDRWVPFRRKVLGHKHGRVIQQLVSGGLAGGISRTCVAPLETIKVKLMCGADGAGGGAWGMLHTILEKEGWKGLYKGNGANVIRVVPSKAIELYTFDYVRMPNAPCSASLLRPPTPTSALTPFPLPSLR